MKRLGCFIIVPKNVRNHLFFLCYALSLRVDGRNGLLFRNHELTLRKGGCSKCDLACILILRMMDVWFNSQVIFVNYAVFDMLVPDRPCCFRRALHCFSLARSLALSVLCFPCLLCDEKDNGGADPGNTGHNDALRDAQPDRRCVSDGFILLAFFFTASW